jgi:hypothetical protein
LSSDILALTPRSAPEVYVDYRHPETMAICIFARRRARQVAHEIVTPTQGECNDFLGNMLRPPAGHNATCHGSQQAVSRSTAASDVDAGVNARICGRKVEPPWKRALVMLSLGAKWPALLKAAVEQRASRKSKRAARTRQLVFRAKAKAKARPKAMPKAKAVLPVTAKTKAALPVTAKTKTKATAVLPVTAKTKAALPVTAKTKTKATTQAVTPVTAKTKTKTKTKAKAVLPVTTKTKAETKTTPTSNAKH